MAKVRLTGFNSGADIKRAVRLMQAILKADKQLKGRKALRAKIRR